MNPLKTNTGVADMNNIQPSNMIFVSGHDCFYRVHTIHCNLVTLCGPDGEYLTIDIETLLIDMNIQTVSLCKE